jgi:MGT family glycosyltransferase
VDDRLREIFDEVRPDAIIEDNVLCFPAIHHSGRPWARIVSCNPLELKDEAIAPVFSGYPTHDTSGWGEFRAAYKSAIGGLHAEFSEFCSERGAPQLQHSEFIHQSDWLNLYVYPAEVDYRRIRPLAPTWHRLETCVRRSDESTELPPHIASGDGALVYLSLGSLGSADVDLMRHLVDVLSRSRHRIVVSKGPQHTEFQLADNMWGAEFLPQPALLPHVDVVITHSGNNTATECFHFGKPMVALPLFWDQYDNAQRIDETGFGIRLPTYEFAEADLLGALDRLLEDADLHARMAAIAVRTQSSPGTERAAALIERLAREHAPIAH